MNREEWLKERRNGIGGSDAAAAIGVCPYKDRLTLWAEKLGLADPPDLSGNEAVESGIQLERAIGEWYGTKYRRSPVDERCGLVTFPNAYTIERHPTIGFMFATIDAWETFSDGGLGVVQIKNTAFPADAWEERLPVNYVTQLRHEMIVAGVTRGTLVALHRGQALRVYPVTLDPDEAAALIAAEEQFWNLVESETLPPAGPHSADTVKALFPRSTAEDVVPLAHEADDLDAELEQVKADIARLTERRDKIESQLKLWIGDHVAGLTPQGIKFSWKGSEINYKPQEARTAYVRRFTRSAKK